jgi:succinate dehydrogenase / fumarate reductase flavoprotein subunit
MTTPLERSQGDNPFNIAHELQDLMQVKAGIIRNEADLNEALAGVQKIKDKAKSVKATGGRAYNPGWHQALDLRSMLICSEAVVRSAIGRRESRGGHSREDFPNYDKEMGKVNQVIKKGTDGEMQIRKEPLPQMPAELQELFKGD